PRANGPEGGAEAQSGTDRGRSGAGFGNIEQRQRSAGQGGEFRQQGEQRTPRGRTIVTGDLPVERAKKMVVRRGSEKQEMFAQQLREKRVDSRFVGELRIQKALALTGVGSRRDCDEWVAQGRVSINGARAEPGARVRQGDRVLFDGKPLNIKWPDRLPRIVIYHKQEGELVSRDDPAGRTTVFDRLPKVQSSAWVAVGRLDFNTSGLLIFTTSGDLANRMMHPSFEVEREYAVRVLGSLTDEQKQQLLSGVQLDDGEAHFDVLQDQGGEGQNHWYRVILREGRNREVRRMFEHFDLQVSRLMRVRFGSLTLPSRLKRGQYYELEEPEVLSVLKWAGLGLTGRTPSR
ncbi:pseudouridine synthase, partial [Chitinimonas sp.]|uniref:pseudouridine synthase n=1 Tax=Chitinimonas sp. TaxID=1934313 RepID=UPI0035B3331D